MVTGRWLVLLLAAPVVLAASCSSTSSSGSNTAGATSTASLLVADLSGNFSKICTLAPNNQQSKCKNDVGSFAGQSVKYEGRP